MSCKNFVLIFWTLRIQILDLKKQVDIWLMGNWLMELSYTSSKRSSRSFRGLFILIATAFLIHQTSPKSKHWWRVIGRSRMAQRSRGEESNLVIQNAILSCSSLTALSLLFLFCLSFRSFVRPSSSFGRINSQWHAAWRLPTAWVMCTNHYSQSNEFVRSHFFPIHSKLLVLNVFMIFMFFFNN